MGKSPGKAVKNMADPIETVNNNTEPTAQIKEEPETYSKDYVHALREENKAHRTAKKQYEDKLKGILGVDNLDDLDTKITAYNDSWAKKLKEAEDKTNTYIIESELSKAIGEGYNGKLTRKLLDRSSITVTDGKVEGLTEALKKLEEEYPEVKKTEPPKTAEGTGTGKTSTDKMDEERKKFRKALGL